MEKKIYGVYPGSIKNLEEVENYSELELFLAIYSLESYILSYKRIVAYNMIKGVDTQESEYALEYLINKTQKFGVEIEKDSIGKSIRIGDYASWYEYYLTYVSSILNKEEFAKVIREKEKGNSISVRLPISYLEYKNSLNDESQKYRKMSM